MAAKTDQKAAFESIDWAEVEALIQRVESAIDNDLDVSQNDLKLLLKMLHTLVEFNVQLHNKGTTIAKLRRLAGLVGSSEPSGRDENGKPKRKGKRRRNRNKGFAPPKPKPAEPKVEHHPHTQLNKGDLCPDCAIGTLNKAEPATFMRFTGQPPLQAIRHVLERLRCSACGAYFTAELSEAYRNDGPSHQHYGYSARAVMCINKILSGQPYFRQQSMQGLFGMNVSANAVYEQCRHVAELCEPIYQAMILMAANAPNLALDDTGNRILDQTEKSIPDRRTQKPRIRTGVYTSCVIAILADGNSATLFKTNIGHAGEWLDEILAHRNANAPPPILMSDALNRNWPSVIEHYEKSLCNAHARREFHDALNHAPQVQVVLDSYVPIWNNNTYCHEQQFDDTRRQQYHEQHSLPAMRRIQSICHQWLDSGEVEENSQLGKACRYFLRHFDELCAFCHIPGALLDNNAVERQFKLIILIRKNSLFYRSENGARVGDILSSVMATAVNCGVNVFDYLVTLQQNWFDVGRNPHNWMPWNYQQNGQGASDSPENLAA